MTDYPSDAAGGAIVALIFGILLIPILIVSLLTIIGKWQIYSKAGKPGWAAIIPIYSTIVMLEIVGKPIWWVFLIIFPCTSFIFFIWTTNLLSKSFKQSEGFTVGLLIFPFLFYPILGFGNYQYAGPSASEAAAFNGYNNNTDPFNTPPQN
jgi:hypothetical protein